MHDPERELIEMLLDRLERVPVDSTWAHRASGLRGSLLDKLEVARAGKAIGSTSVNQLARQAFWLLEQAAAERNRTGIRPRVPWRSRSSA